MHLRVSKTAISAAIFADQGNLLPMDVQPQPQPPPRHHNRLITSHRELIGLYEPNPALSRNGSITGMTNHPNPNYPQPIFVSSYISDSVPPPPPTDDTGLSTACNLIASRKRSRDSFSFPPARQIKSSSMDPCRSTSFSFLGKDVSLEFQQQQLEIDQLVAMHAEQMKLCIQERRNRVTRGIVEAVEQEMATKLRERDEELAKIGQINLALQEKVKTLCNENQVWKDLAHRNEITANALKTNLDHMLDQIQQENQQSELNQSSCSSNSVINGGETAQRCCPVPASGGRVCRRCGTQESSVLLLPCRHLCVCSGCGSSVHTCPICHCTKNGSVNINLSSF